jgi:hypothetical protein
MKNKRVCVYRIYEVLRVWVCDNCRAENKEDKKYLRNKDLYLLPLHEKKRRMQKLWAGSYKA